MEPKVRLGQIGLEHPHAFSRMDTALKECENLELVRVAEPLEAIRSRVGDREVKLSADPAAIWDDAEIEGVIIGSHVNDFSKYALPCIQNGKHVLIEKPMAVTVAEADVIIDAASGAGVFVQVGYHYRSNGALRKMNEVLRSGQLGRQLFVRGHLFLEGSGFLQNRELLTDLGRTGEDSILGIGCHMLDLLLWYGGESKQAFAISTKAVNSAVLDLQVASLVFESGALGSLEVGWFEQDAMSARYVEVVCEKGRIRCAPLDDPKLEIIRGQGEIEAVPFEVYGSRHRFEMDEFARCIREGTKPLSNAETAREVLLVREMAFNVGWRL